VALEVKYHRQCYQRYTEFVRRTDVTEDDEVRAKCKYEESFNFFCERFVKEKLIDNEEIYYMKKIEAEFVRTVATVENCDASGYRRFRLKERLIKRFPQPVFHTPYERNRSEISSMLKVSVKVSWRNIT
jgi:hypothetical protein